MTTLLELTKKLHNTLALYNGAGHALGWKTEKVDKLLDESKQVIELAEQPAQQEPTKLPGMAVQALAGEIIEALIADEKDGGFDLTAGMFGPNFSTLVRRWAAAEWNTSPPAQPAQQEPVTVLPDGSAFAVMSYPLPKDHWLYADRQYNDGEYEPVELGKPVLTHELRDAVVSAVRYAIRGATNCGKEVDFDPDALVQNAVYALCGPFTSPQAQPSKPLTDEQEYEAIGTAGNDLLALAKRWADNEVHVYQFDNEARKIIKAVLHRAHGIKEQK